MKIILNRVRSTFLFCIVTLIIAPLVASCTFGLTPATLGRSSATVSIAFPSGTMPPPASPSSRAGSGDSRAVAPGANWLYLRAGEGDGSFDTYGPYEVGSGTFTTKDIPAGTYDYLAILLVSESIPAKTELSVGDTIITFSGALSLPDGQFFSLLSGGTLSSFFDSRFCVASGYVIKQCKISSGKNVISATLVPLTSRTATVIANPSSASFSCPLNDSGSLRPVYFKVGALTYPESAASPSVKVAIALPASASSSRVGSVFLYGETGALLGKLDVNGILTVDKEKPEASSRTFTVENPTRGALYVYASYENALDIGLTPVLATLPANEGTYVSSKGTAGAAGTRADPQSLAYAVNKSESSTILLLDNVETNVTLSVTYPLTVKPASGVTAPRIKATSGFDGSYFSVVSGGKLILEGVYLDGNESADASTLDIAGGSATLTGGTVISGTKGVPAPGGGAALVSQGTLVLDGATIEKCSSARGGGVYVTGTGTLVVKGSSSIRECAATELGGGVYAENGGTVDISAAGVSAITSNGAQRGGGGAFLCESAAFTEGSGGWATRIAGNNADYALPNLARRVPVTSDAELTIAVQDSPTPRYIDILSDFAVMNTLIPAGECALSSSSARTISRYGSLVSSAIINVTAGTSLSIGGSLTIAGLGTGTPVASALVRIMGGTFALRESAALINNINTCSITSTTYLGGAVNVNGGTFIMYGGVLGMPGSGNSALCGGNVYVSNGKFVLRGGFVQYGHATDTGFNGAGGGVFVDGNSGTSSFEMPIGSTGCISANIAESFGGGLALKGSQATALLAGGYIGGLTSSDGNSAISYTGGGVEIDTNGSTVTLSGTKIMYNIAKTCGGGISVASVSTLTIDPAVNEILITNNTAQTSAGGGLYCSQPSGCSASPGLMSIVISGNSAPNNTSTKEWSVP